MWLKQKRVSIRTRQIPKVNLQASIGLLTFAASNTETAHAALVRHSEAGRSRDDGWDFALVVQFAMVLEAVDDVGNGEPQALAPIVGLAESGTGLLFLLDAFGTILARSIRVAAALATTVLPESGASNQDHVLSFENSVALTGCSCLRASYPKSSCRLRDASPEYRDGTCRP